MMLLVTVAVLCLCAADVVRGECNNALQGPNGLTIHKVIDTWEGAQIQCASEGAVLASPLNSELLTAMRSVIGDTAYYIGAKSSHFSGVFTSLEGVQLDNMTAEVSQLVQQLDRLAGDCLSMDRDSIRVVPCCTRLPYMCYKLQSETPEGTPGQNAAETKKPKQCRSGYTYYERPDTCYKMPNGEKTWSEASAACEADGAHLIVIDDANEAQALTNLEIHGYPHTFIGLYDYTGEGGWKTVTGKPLSDVFHKWRKGDPSGNKTDEFFCGGFLATGRIANFYCKDTRKYICEHE